MLMSAFSEVVSLGAVIPFLSALGNAASLLREPRLSSFISAFNISSSVQLVNWLAIAFVIITIITNVLRVLTLYFQAHLAARIASDLGCLLYRKVLLQKYDFYCHRNSSDLITLVQSDAGSMGGIVSATLLIAINSFVALSLIVGLFFIDAEVTLTLASILGVIYTALYYWRRSKLFENGQLLTQHGQLQIKVLQESVGGIREVILAGCQEFFQSTYTHSSQTYYRAGASNQTIASSPRYAIEMVAMVAIGLLALTFGRDGDFGQAVPILGSFALGANRLLPTMQQSFSALARMQGCRYPLKRVLQTFRRPIEPLRLGVKPDGLHQSLRLEDVWFRYGVEEDWVLRSLNLSIPARSKIGLVGTSGSGKSTTADLILGLLQPERGTIWVDDQPLIGDRLRAWQLSIAHVPQSIFLSDATIAENIAFGVPPHLIAAEQVAEAARLARLAEFIESLPEGYDTVVGERGIRLSGGQRQRVGIARALYRGAKVIIFDEATSALDNTTEREVMGAIAGLSGELTIILIAHRLTTIKRCDCIFEFSQGQVVASGTYNELLATSPSFQRMATTTQ